MIRALFLENLSLWSCVWQSTLLIVIGLTAGILLRHRPARAFQVLLLAMMAAVLVPTMSLLVKHFELGVFAAGPIESRAETIEVLPKMPLGVSTVVTEPQLRIEAMDTATDGVLAEGGSGGTRIPWRTTLLFGWMSVTLILLGRLLVAFINGIRLIRRSQPKVCAPIQQALDRARVRLEISRNLEIRSSGEITSPMIWCWSRTVVLLVPRDLDNDVDWAGVACHELAHCMRQDHISGLIAEMMACLLCWNPLSWLAKKRLVWLSEQACDDWVVAGEQPIENYARSLLDFRPQKQAAFLPGVVHSNQGVAARVHRILEENSRNPRAGVKWALVSSTVVALLSVGIAFARTRPAQAQDVPQVPTPAVKTIHDASAEAEGQNADFKKYIMQVRVEDNEGMPIKGASIHRSVWTKVRIDSNADYIANDNGEVSMELPESKSILRLWATKNGYVPLFVNFDSRQMDGLAFPDEFTFTMEKGTTIGGFVVDESGAPIAKAKVEVTIDSRDPDGRGGVGVSRWLASGEDGCMTDMRGYWSLSNVPAGNSHMISLWLTHPGYVDDLSWRSFNGQQQFTLKQLRDRVAKNVMENGVKVSGVLTDQNDNPIPKAMVVWGDKPYHNERDQQTFTDKRGLYQLPPLAAGSTVLTVVAPGSAPQLKPIKLNGSSMTVDFQLTRGKTIRFSFVDGDGKPIPEARVNIAGWRGRETLFNWRHPNVPYSKIPDRANSEGVYVWDWAPEDPVEFYFYEEGVRSKSEKRIYGPGAHQIILQRNSP